MTIVPGNVTSDGCASWFSGAGAVCGVGSLPFLATAPAIDFIARWCPEVPFWPQLRRMSAREGMIPQTFGLHARHLAALRDEHGFGLALERGARFLEAIERADAHFEPANAAGFYAFVDACERGVFSGARALKGQVMGPVTTACSLQADGLPCVDNAVFFSAIADYIVRLARWQVETLLKCAASVVLVLDEAYLGVALRQQPARREAIVSALKAVILRVRRPGVLVGVHCCDEIPLSLLNEIEPDLYSFDAHHGGTVFGHDADARRFVYEGGHVAWGWVPTRDDLTGINADDVADRWFDAATALCGGDAQSAGRIHTRSLVTASCGLAGSSVATCERSFQIARNISAGFARRASAA